MIATVKNPFIMTIFGASGDLTKLLLAPAIYSLFEQGRLPADFYIVGFSRTPKEVEQFKKEFIESIKKTIGSGVKEKVLNDLAKHIYYFSGQYGVEADFVMYRKFLLEFAPMKNATHLAYFSVPATQYRGIIENLAATRGSKDEDIRLVLEKPFGQDKQTAEEIYHFALQHFREEQFYLLDHYLGKPAVRSIMHLRESNRILSHMMRGYEIANIQITAAEDFGVKDRGNYYEQAGAIKDFVQSHLLQMLSLVTMSLPIEKIAMSLQREKFSVLSAIACPTDPENAVVGQYQSYTNEKGVDKKSSTETFVALRLFIDRLDWDGVPIYLRHGKKLKRKQTYVVVELKKFPFQTATDPANRVVFEIYPFEQLHLTLLNKQEDPPMSQEITVSHSVACNIVDKCLPPGHAPLILDALMGEKKYFLSFSEIIASWGVVDKIIGFIQSGKVKVEKYADGSAGPKAQDRLTAMDGFTWYELKS